VENSKSKGNLGLFIIVGGSWLGAAVMLFVMYDMMLSMRSMHDNMASVSVDMKSMSGNIQTMTVSMDSM
jgi:hypothetical protein